MSKVLPQPRLTKIFRLEATLGEAVEVGDVAQGRRRVTAAWARFQNYNDRPR